MSKNLLILPSQFPIFLIWPDAEGNGISCIRARATSYWTPTICHGLFQVLFIMPIFTPQNTLEVGIVTMF